MYVYIMMGKGDVVMQDAGWGCGGGVVGVWCGWGMVGLGGGTPHAPRRCKVINTA